MACQSFTSDNGVVSTVAIGPIDASNPVEGEHLTQREYWAEYLGRAQREAREFDARLLHAKRLYEMQSRQMTLLGHALGLALNAQMLNGMVDHLKVRK